MSRLLLAVVLAGLGAVVAAPVPAKKSAWLIVSARTGTANIFLLSEGDSEPKNLTDSKANNSYPSWSPDGKKIAFSSDRDGVYHIYTMDADGKNVKALTKGDLACRVPSWSADGKTIAFCRYTAANSSEICTVDASGGDPKVIDAGGDGWDPMFSPDGKSIAFVSFRDGDGFRVYTIDADGKHLKKLTAEANPTGYGYPAWSPDGKSIAFGHGTGEGLNLYVVGSDGTDVKPLTKTGGLTVYAGWSPDGKKIAYFSQTTGDKGAFFVADSDGSNAKELLKDETHVEGGRPVWRPK